MGSKKRLREIIKKVFTQELGKTAFTFNNEDYEFAFVGDTITRNYASLIIWNVKSRKAIIVLGSFKPRPPIPIVKPDEIPPDLEYVPNWS